jgi:hypothetical protein
VGEEMKQARGRFFEKKLRKKLLLQVVFNTARSGAKKFFASFFQKRSSSFPGLFPC